MTNEMTRAASLNVRLYLWWTNVVPDGRGMSMDEMMDAMDVADSQTIRVALTRLRQGRVRNPAESGAYFPPLPVRWNAGNRLYYDLSSMTPEAVAAQVPGGILAGTIGELLNRVATIESSLGRDGLVASAERLLGDVDTRALILQIPLEEIWAVQDHLQAIGRARELLALPPGGGREPLPSPEEQEAEEE